MKIQGLVSDDITPMVDRLLTSLSKAENISSEKLHIYLKENAKEFFDEVESAIVDEMVGKYDVTVFRNKFDDSKNILDQIVKKNEEVFHCFYAYIEASKQVYSRFLKKVSDKGLKASELESRDFTIIALYGNLCRQADQICTMLMHGHPDAALRLWRIFYEHCVIAVFLMKHNTNELADRFRDVTYKEKKRTVESYGKRHESFNFPPLDENFIKRTNEEFEAAKKVYEEKFFDKDFSWAKPYVNGNPNFGAVEESVNMERYRPYYIWASTKVHPTFMGITDFRDNQDNIILDRITKEDALHIYMIDPAQLTIGCFYEVNDYFFELYAGHEYEVNLTLFRKLWERFSEVLKKKQGDAT